MERKFSQDAAYNNRLKVIQNYISPQLQHTSALFGIIYSHEKILKPMNHSIQDLRFKKVIHFEKYDAYSMTNT